MGTKFDRLNFRENSCDTLYLIFILPLILLIEIVSSENATSDHRLIDYLKILNSCSILLAYRFNLSWHLFTFLQIIESIVTIYYHCNGLILIITILNPIINVLLLKYMRLLNRKYLKCFTFVEFSIVFELFYHYLIDSVIFNLRYWSNTDLQDNINELESFQNICSIFMTLLILYFIVFNISTAIPFKFAMLTFPIALYSYLFIFLNKHEPVQWLLGILFKNQTRIFLLIIWSMISLLTLLFVFIKIYYFYQEPSTTITRKLFHLSITLVYLLGIEFDVILLYFSSKLLLFLFILIEILHLKAQGAIGDIVDRIFQHFRDEKDQGLLTVTHVYLLIGCSLPLWLYYDYNYRIIENNESVKILLLSGIMTIGIADTAASIFGKKFGRTKWSSIIEINNNKTLLGTFGFFVSHSISFILMDQYFSSHKDLSNLNYLALILINSLICSLYETFTRHIDNLLLPLIEYLLIRILF